MIRSDRELEHANEALGDLYRAVAALRREYADSKPASFSLLVEGPLHEIAKIQAEIEQFTGLSFARHDQAPLWLRLVGRKARWGETPASVLTAFLDALRKGIQSVANFNVNGRVGGRPPIDVQEACDIELVSVAPGSFQVGVRLPEPEVGELFPESKSRFAELALRDFLIAAHWASSNTSLNDLVMAFQDATRRRVALRAVKALVPRSQGGIDLVELSGVAVPDKREIRLAPPAAERILGALETAISEQEEQHEGDMREIDLDKRSFKLRNVPVSGEVSCRFSDDLYSTATEFLGKRVRVIGTRITKEGTRGIFEVVDIEKVESRVKRT